MPVPPADLLAIRSDLHAILTRLSRRAGQTAASSVDKPLLIRATRHLATALSDIDGLLDAWQSED